MKGKSSARFLSPLNSNQPKDITNQPAQNTNTIEKFPPGSHLKPYGMMGGTSEPPKSIRETKNSQLFDKYIHRQQ